MKCECGGDTKVVDSREVDGENATRRRHQCLKCKKRFTTYERPDLPDETLKTIAARMDEMESTFKRYVYEIKALIRVPYSRKKKSGEQRD